MEVEKVSPQFEQEVTKISLEIEQRRNKLEQEAGIESHERVAREVIGEAIRTAGTGAHAHTPENSDVSYLDSAPEEEAHQVNALIDMIKEKGLTAAISDARTKTPYILDAFHDALVEKLYNTLKTGNYI